MKKFNNKILLIIVLLISVYGFIAGCTHKNEPAPAFASGTVAVSHGKHIHLPGTMVAGDSTQWKFDQVHSNVTWSTPYLGVGAMLTGRFNQFGVGNVTSALMTTYATTKQPVLDTAWAFYENEPSKTHFNGYVQINTSNTGQPGRDQGCYIGTMGTTAYVAGTQNLLVTNIAQIKTTSVVFDPLSNNYIATFSFTWKGNLTNPLTETIVGKLSYIPVASVNGLYNEFGLELQFQFNCRDFGITSTNIADKINIDVNANFNNK